MKQYDSVLIAAAEKVSEALAEAYHAGFTSGEKENKQALDIALEALEKIAGEMEMPFNAFGGLRGNALIVAAGEWRRDQDRTIAQEALKRLKIAGSAATIELEPKE